MDWMMWIVPVAAGAIVMALLWRNYRLHKNIEEFAGKVEQALDVISSGREWKPEAQMEDSLWGRTETQLASRHICFSVSPRRAGESGCRSKD